MTAIVVIPRGTKVVRIAAAVLALLASVATIRSGVAEFLSRPTTVDLALMVDPGSSWARSVAIDERLKTVQLGKDATVLGVFSRQTLLRSPYDVVALRTAGIIEAAADDEPAANRLLSVAARLSLRDYLTHAWLMNYRLTTGALTGAVQEADILIRQQPDNADIVIPALVALADDPRMTAPLASLLKTRPVWRSLYITKLGETGKDSSAIFRLLVRLKQIGSPPTTDEMFTYFVLAGQRVPPRQLYAQWLSMLPATVAAKAGGNLRDGDFAGLDAPAPFAWRLYPNDGVYAERESGPAGMGSALYASFLGERDSVFANQALVLNPGRYRLSWRVFADDAVEGNIFRWTVTCGRSNTIELGRAPIVSVPGKLVSSGLQFVVPNGCAEQILTLTGAGVGGMDTLSIHLDNLKLDLLN